MNRWLIANLVFTLAVASTCAMANKPASSDWQALAPVFRDESLNKEAKIKRVLEYFKDDPTCHRAIMWIARLDEKLARQLLAKEFANPKRATQDKIRIGNSLLTDDRFNGKGEFIDAYAPWLIDQVIAQKGQVKDVLVENLRTPIGEYGNIANSFQGHKSKHFSKIRDRRVIPVLVAALDMPDRIYGAGDGHHVRGKPGDSTGRNLDRQNVPVALAKLGAVEAIPAMRRILEKHHDWHLRNNSAFALAVLMHPKDRGELIKWFGRNKGADYRKKEDRYRHLFAFGRGLLHRGEDDVTYMGFEYSIYHNRVNLSETTYMYEERLKLVTELRSRKIAGFYRQAFEYEPLMNVFMFDRDKVKTNDYGHTTYNLDRAEARILELFDQTATLIERNRLTELEPWLKKLATNSKNGIVRMRASECMKKLAASR